MSRIEGPDATLAPGIAIPLPARPTPESPLQRLVRGAVHFLTYHFVLKRRKTIESYAAGFRFTVPPTVFHPSVFKTGEYFAEFIGGLDLRGRRGGRCRRPRLASPPPAAPAPPRPTTSLTTPQYAEHSSRSRKHNNRTATAS